MNTGDAIWLGFAIAAYLSFGIAWWVSVLARYWHAIDGPEVLVTPFALMLWPPLAAIESVIRSTRG